MFDRYLRAFGETLTMVGVSVTIASGLTLALLLVATAPGGLYPRRRFNKGLSVLVNVFRAVAFIILLVALMAVAAGRPSPLSTGAALTTV